MSSEKCVRCSKESTPWVYDSTLGGHLCQSCTVETRTICDMGSFYYWQGKIPEEATLENLFYLGLERGMEAAAALFPPGSSQNDNIHKRLRKILREAPSGSILVYEREIPGENNG